MTDITIESAAHPDMDGVCVTGHLTYEVSPTERVTFYVNSDSDFVYSKILSGVPQTPVVVHAGTVQAVTIYAKEWVTGAKTDTTIHLCVGDSAPTAGSYTLSYYWLDVSNYSLTGEVEILTNLTWTAGAGSIAGTKCLSVVQTHEGQLLLPWRTDITGGHGLQQRRAHGR